MMIWLSFLALAAITISGPGPGVALTVGNALRFGFAGAFSGILGLCAGTCLVAGVAGMGLGVFLAHSDRAYAVIRILGALYLIYLGIRFWRTSADVAPADTPAPAARRRLLEGFAIQALNPNAILFFVAVLPQFADPSEAFLVDCLTLVVIYNSLLICIHSGYALLASRARCWATGHTRSLGRATGLMFMAAGAWLFGASS